MPWSDKAVAAEQAKQAAKEQAAKDRAARVAAAAEARQAERDLAAWQAARRGRH